MTIRCGYADTSGGQVHYRHVEGPEPAIVFLHRTPASSASFVPVLEALDGFRSLYAMDTPGFGASFDPVGDASMDDYRDWLAAALDDIQIDPCHIYGHHTGTHIAAALATGSPDRVLSLMLNGVAFYTAEERSARLAAVSPPATPDEAGEYLSATWKLMKSLFPVFDPTLINREVTGALRSRPGIYQAFRAIWQQDFPAVLAQARCPVLAMSAEDDVFIDLLERVPAALPHVECRVLASAGIATPELDTENCADLVRDWVSRADA